MRIESQTWMFDPAVPCRGLGACRDIAHRPIVDPCCDRFRHPVLVARRLCDRFDRCPPIVGPWLPWEIDYADHLRQTNRQMPLIAPVPLPPSDPRFEPVPIRTPSTPRPVETTPRRPVEPSPAANANSAPKLGDITAPAPPPPLRRVERVIERHAPAATGKLIDLIA